MKKLNFFHPLLAYPAIWLLMTLISQYKMSDDSKLIIASFWLVYFIASIVFYNLSNVSLVKTLYIPTTSIPIPPSDIITKSKRFFEVIVITHILILLTIIRLYGGTVNPEFLRFKISETLGGFIGFPLFVISVLYFYHVSLALFDSTSLKARLLKSFTLLVIIYPYLIIGSRALLGIYIFTFFSIFYLTKKLPNWKLLAGGIVGALAAIGIRLGTIFASTDEGRINFFLTNKIINKNIWESLLSLLDYTVQNVLFRTDMIIKNVPQNYDFLYGEGIFFGFITLLPGKQVSPYIALNHNLFVGSNEDIEYPPTLISQLYLDFGHVGVIAGAILLAVFYNKLYIKYYKKKDFLSLFYYLIFTFYFLLSIYGALQLIYIVLFPIMTIVLFKFLNYRKWKY